MEYTEGVCGDGAAILFNGQPITITQILEKLNEASKAEEMIVELLEQRDLRDEVLGDIASLLGEEFTSSYGFKELYAELEERL